jgi:hypothetical protein
MHGAGCEALPVTQSLGLQAREQFIAAETGEFSVLQSRKRLILCFSVVNETETRSRSHIARGTSHCGSFMFTTGGHGAH